MRVAILGIRGIPAQYGGFETLAEELSFRLPRSHGIDVTVYCRSAYYPEKLPRYGGADLVYLPMPRVKGLESILHTAFAGLHALFRDYDVLFVPDPANAPVCLLLRLAGKRLVVHTDGLGWMRRKWGPVTRWYYRWAEWVAAKGIPYIVTDNPEMQTYYRTQYGRDSRDIPYGSEARGGRDETILHDLGLSPSSYCLAVARLEPENNPDIIIREYTSSGIAMPLVVVGDSPYNTAYFDGLRAMGDKRIRFAGRINDQARLNALYANAYLYIHGHEVGGTNPSLLRAMGAGAAPAVLDVPFNRAVIKDRGFFFQKSEGSLRDLLRELAENRDVVQRTAAAAQERAKSAFTWDKVASDYAGLFTEVARAGR